MWKIALTAGRMTGMLGRAEVEEGAEKKTQEAAKKAFDPLKGESVDAFGDRSAGSFLDKKGIPDFVKMDATEGKSSKLLGIGRETKTSNEKSDTQAKDGD